jgi:SCY1-like protein 2
LQHSHYILHHILTFADILPIIALGLSSPTHAVVDAALSTLPAVLPVLDYSTIKNELFPVIAGVFAHTNSLGIKIRGLEAFYTLCGGTAENDSISDGLDGVSISHDSSKLSSSQVLDKFTIQEKVVPMMKGIKTKEPGVMVSLIIEHKRSTLANCSRWLHSRCSDK